jgi:hypothetical protein
MQYEVYDKHVFHASKYLNHFTTAATSSSKSTPTDLVRLEMTELYTSYIHVRLYAFNTAKVLQIENS